MNQQTWLQIFTFFYVACNTLRIVACLPKIRKMLCDRCNAKAVSATTWGLFAFANASAILYASQVAGDALLATSMSTNTAACVLVAALSAWRQRDRE